MSDHGYRTLLAAIHGLRKGYPVTIDLIRDECDAAMLTSAEKGEAFRLACVNGYLTGVFMTIPGYDVKYPVRASIPSTHPAGKGRNVRVYRRTAKRIPAHLCKVDAVATERDSWDNGDSKTAPGVASTTSGSLAPTPLTRKEA